MQLFSIRR